MCGSISIENISFSRNCDIKITNAKSVTDATIWVMFISKNSDTLEIAEHSLFNAHRTLHDTTRHDTTRQPPTRKSCNVRGSTTRRDTTRQKSGLVVSDLTMLDICDKARFLSCRVASCRRPPHITRFSCRGLSRRVVSRRVV